MGGALILVAMCVGTLLWADLSNRFVWIVLLDARSRFGVIGFYDDYLKLVVRNSKGLAARYKYLCAVGRRPVRGILACTGSHQSPAETTLYVPFFKTVGDSDGDRSASSR